MTICAFCKSEALPDVDGVHLCESCSAESESVIGKPKTDRQIRAALYREIQASTARAHAASEELVAIMADIPSGLPHPDGCARIQNAAYALAAARKEVMKAHSRLNEFLACGVVPSD